MEWVFTFTSQYPWPSVVVMAWVHWNEKSWILALQRILDEWISLLYWKLTIIFANLYAIEQNRRFVDLNMNRCFWRELSNSKEEVRVQELLPCLQQADILLDLHNTVGDSASPFLITNSYWYNTIFQVDYVLQWIDHVQVWWSDWYMESIWKVGLCLECGSVVDDISLTTDYAYDMVINFLQYVNIIQWSHKTFRAPKSVKARIMVRSYDMMID